MSAANLNTLIIASAVVIVAALAFFLLRGRIKTTKVKVGPVSGELATHQPDGTQVKNVVQKSTQGGNKATVRGDNVNVDDFKQTAKKNNDLTIGNP